MRYNSNQIKGKGRGKFLGFPTINLKISGDFKISEGIYATKVNIGGKDLVGALHYGPIPVYQESHRSLEIFIIDAPADFKTDQDQQVFFEPVEKIRDIMNFQTPELLSEQISKDVELVKKILNT